MRQRYRLSIICVNACFSRVKNKDKERGGRRERKYIICNVAKKVDTSETLDEPSL